MSPDYEFVTNDELHETWKMYFETMDLHMIRSGWLRAKIIKRKLHIVEDGKLAYTQQGRELADGTIEPGTHWTVIFGQDVQDKWFEWSSKRLIETVEGMCGEEAR
jgi:hypothetical protein